LLGLAGGARKLGAAHLRHREHLFPASTALLARVDGDLGAVHGTHALLGFLISDVNPKECSYDPIIWERGTVDC